MDIDVDSTVVLSVNLMPLIDDTDFKTRETAIVYNQAGMDLVWNFITTAGVFTQTAIAPTTAGDYDWSNKGDGMYGIEMPTSGGASINNDTEGTGWFSGVCTGVLPWISERYTFKAAVLNGSLVNNGEALATASQLAGLANVGAAVHRPAASYNLTTGTQSANTYTATEALDGTNHEHTDDTGALDLYYEFNIGAGFASSVQVTGYVTGLNDDVDVYGYDWIAAAWVQIGNIQGGAIAANQVNSFDMFVDMVGSGANQGVVRVRFYKASGLTTATLAIDQIFVAFNQTAEGYQNAAIWLDTNASNTNTIRGVDGTATNPVSTIAAANILLTSTGLAKVEVLPHSNVTFAVSQNDQVFRGDHWTLALGGQDIEGITIIGAHVSGAVSGSGTHQEFRSCYLGATSHLKETHFTECGIEGAQTVVEAGNFFFDRCHSHLAGIGTWIFDFGDAIGSTNLNWRNGSGGIQLESMGDTGTDSASIEGRGQVIEGTCTGGTVAIRGAFTTSGITNLTLSDDSRYDSTSLISRMLNTIVDGTFNIAKSWGKRLRGIEEYQGYEGGFIYVDTIGGSSGDDPYTNGTLDNPVNNMVDLNSLSASLNMHSFKVISGSVITLAASQEKQIFSGEIYTLALGGQNINGTTFHGANVSGTATGGAVKPKFEDCNIGDVTIPPSHLDKCGLAGTITANAAGDYFLADNCHSAVAGTGAPCIDFGAAIGDVGINLRWYSGGIELKNMGQTGADKASIEGNGQVIINANSIGGTIAIRGHQTLTGEDAFVTAGGVISDGARFATDQFAPLVALVEDIDTSAESAAKFAATDALVNAIDTSTESAARFTEIKGAGWTDETLKAIKLTLDEVAPNGIRQVILQYYITGGSTPIPGVEVSIYNSDLSAFLERKTTDANGQIIMGRDDGTFKLIAKKAEYAFTVPETIVVTQNETFTKYGDSFTIPLPGDPDACNLYIDLVDLGLAKEEGVEFTANLVPIRAKAGTVILNAQPYSESTDVNGRIIMTLAKGFEFTIASRALGKYSQIVTIDTTDVDTLNLADFID